MRSMQPSQCSRILSVTVSWKKAEKVFQLQTKDKEADGDEGRRPTGLE